MTITRDAGYLVIDGVQVPRLAFGYGSLMKWSSDRKPMVTDSSKEVGMALEVGYRHLDGGELYLNSESVGEAIRSSGLNRSELFVSLKINTYSNIGFSGPDHIHKAALKQIETLGLEGYIDCVQLHFPPRGKKGNLTNREAWRCLEDLKDKKIARVIGVSNWELHDYHDMMKDDDLKYMPMLNEIELNPHLFHNEEVQKLMQFQREHGIKSMVFGCLTSLSGRAPAEKTMHLRACLAEQEKKTGLTQSQLVLRWAYDRTGGIVVTSTSKSDRAREAIEVIGSQPLDASVMMAMEEAARADGSEDQRCYKHPHMQKA